MAELRVRFADPEHGWIGLSIDGPGVAFRQACSHVPYDSLLELTTALSLCVEGGCEQVARWSLEPGELALTFERREDAIHLSVARGGPAEARTSGTPEEILVPFWRALRDLESRFPPEDLKFRWREPFPADALRRLSERLRK